MFYIIHMIKKHETLLYHLRTTLRKRSQFEPAPPPPPNPLFEATPLRCSIKNNPIKKENLEQVIASEYCETFKKNPFTYYL